MYLHHRLILLSALALALGAAPAFAWGDSVTGSGHVVTESRALSGYSAVSVAGSLKVVLRQSGHEGVQVSADDNLLPLVETTVVQRNGMGTLKIRPKSNSGYSTHHEIVVTVDLIDLRSLEAGGSVDVEGKGIKSGALEVALGGSGDVRLHDLQAESAKFSIGGSGDLETSGRVQKLRIAIGGSGDVVTDKCDSDDVEVKVAGSGSAKVKANKTLQVAIAGSGDVTYSGDAKVTQSIAGSGSVTHR